MIRAAAVLLIAATLCPAHIGYKATTDRKIRPEPALPSAGKSGSVIIDPTFGTRIVRITDSRTNDDLPGGPCYTAAAAFQNTWNADSTRYVVACGGTVYSYRFDPKTLKARRDGDPLDMQESPAFSFADPDLAYGIRGHDIREYDFRRKKYRTLLDLDKLVGRFEGSAGLLTVSADERMAVAFAGIQDTWRYVVVFDTKSGRSTLLDTRAGTVDGKPVSLRMGWGVHVANIDKSGRYVLIGKGQGGKAPTLVSWDTGTNRFAEIAPEGGGHWSAGYGWVVNGNGGFWPYWAQWLIRRLDTGRIADFRKLIVPEGPKDYGNRREHSSWNNARPDRWAPVFVSTTRETGAKNPPSPWDNEIIAIGTDPEHPQVFRFAHHRSRLGRDFWDNPRGNVSPDGRFFMFTSNWEMTLGEFRGQPRQDVFVLELPPVLQ